jgi:hypothetical protein
MTTTSVQAEKFNGNRFEQFQQENTIMAFVNELIPEEQKDKFPFPVHIAYDGSKPTLWKWTIDRERDAYLVVTNVLGGGYEGTPPDEYYVLSWGGELVPFAAEQHLAINTQKGDVLTWKIHRLDVPPSLQERRGQVLQLIREALDAQGLLYNRSRVSAVNVQFGSFAN